MLARLRRVAAGGDRPADLGELELTTTPPGPIDLASAHRRRYADLGVHRLVIPPAASDGSDTEQLIASVGETLVGRV